MGLNIDEFAVLGGLATLNNVYVNIRDLKYTKEEGEYLIEFLSYFSKDTKNLNTRLFGKKLSSLSDTSLWTICYDILKENLSSEGYTFTDC